MRKFCAVLGVMLLLLGLRLSDNGLLSGGFAGTYSVYRTDGSVQTFAADELPVLDRLDATATRLDFAGGEAEALQLLRRLNGQIKWREQLDGVTVWYAYSPDLSKSERVCGTAVNLMVAVSPAGRVAAGYPILPGSY